MSATAALPVVGGGGGSVEVGAGTEVVAPPGGVEPVVTVVRGGDTTGVVAWVVVDVALDVEVVGSVEGSVTRVSAADVGDVVDVEAAESSPSLHEAIAGTSSATSTTLLRATTRSIMSLKADKLAAMRDNGRRFAIARLTLHTGCDSTSTGQESP